MPILHVEDDPVDVGNLRRAFSRCGIANPLRAAATGAEALAILRARSGETGPRPGLILLDLSMPGDAFATITEIIGFSPTTKIIIFTAFAEVGLASRAIDAGAHGFVLKGRPLRELHEAIESVQAGNHFVSPGFS